MIPQEIIRKKRDNKTLTEGEIKSFVLGLTNGSFSDSQIASMSMAILINDMTKEETIWLTNAMTNSGDKLDWQDIVESDLVCDKHSTGGVGDKVSLILAPILAACGVYVPMISGRGLGHTGGTLDKFDTIPGYNTQPSIDVFRKVVKDVGCAIIGQTSNLVPADKKLYSIRDAVGAVESIPLITSSILSKKIASGLKNLVLDVKVGNGSFNNTKDVALNLARSLVSVAKGAGLQCQAILTDMNQVLGWNAGHTLEIKECAEYLTNKRKNKRLEKITNELIASVLMMAKKTEKQESYEKINQVLSNGMAAEKFNKMVHALGGPADFLEKHDSLLQSSSYVGEIKANETGSIHSIETRKLGLTLIELGGGRKQVDDEINYAVGYENVVSVGDNVDTSTPLLRVHASSQSDFDRVKNEIEKCFVISDTKRNNLDTIYQTIN
ncbi:MAG: thymidine phosphorylase [Pelagibacteraceae bacterium]|jgi:thymidine phosphorylase|nr:thymidine phosphorylase [Pelagibacteraceae bacterium]HJL57904.1 thymidine phosphorylase [Alphaproteobacteria bacterium]MBO6467875.1 thymidine phosphorylase [Pelagibacteraceae bacterium]MBO6469891.1 thymidine phosphorylase [Pelagibacteraceae bacterium]MBO6479865.1 thymidine phosphorylase [Pelagibacteraceae bacterium]